MCSQISGRKLLYLMFKHLGVKLFKAKNRICCRKTGIDYENEKKTEP